ncbi:hypothetical protein DMH04_37700 [Kibdelosporangium aridum]|uniref:Regulatory protein RecX n=1 Tax=Kibdelosporangium aridum TaxID=2030 RepID=A0A428YYT9_KIBAR|nr:hypothetical protein DMH04_37700 [Kibdelosporangium aridum]
MAQVSQQCQASSRTKPQRPREDGVAQPKSQARRRPVTDTDLGADSNSGTDNAVTDLRNRRATTRRRRGGSDAGAGEERRSRKAAEVDRDPEAHAKDICLTLLTARPRTRAELYKALLRKEIAPEVAEQVLGRLDEVGLIDDKAFAEMWVRSRHTYQGMGRKALSVELRRRGVDNDTAAEAVAAVDEEAEEERARQLVRKKLPSMRSADQQTKIRRLVGVLARKGYSQGLAYRVVRDELAGFGEGTDLLDTLE